MSIYQKPILIWFRFNKLAKIQTCAWFACFYQIRIFSSCSFLQAQSEKEKRVILLHRQLKDKLIYCYRLAEIRAAVKKKQI